MSVVIRSVDGPGFTVQVCLKHLVYGEGTVGDAVFADQREPLSLAHGLRNLMRNGQRDRNRPDLTIGQVHVLENMQPVLLSNKPFERRECADAEQLQIGNRPVRNRHSA